MNLRVSRRLLRWKRWRKKGHIPYKRYMSRGEIIDRKYTHLSERRLRYENIKFDNVAQENVKDGY